MAKRFRILSIDGGGMRGIIPASVLVAVEKRLREETGNESARIADHFDLIAGTSTGGLLACIYLCPDPARSGRPRFTAEEAVQLFFDRGDEIFHRSLWHRAKSANGILDERYPGSGLEEAARDHFGDLALSELLKPCLISAYDIKRRRAHFFTQHDAGSNPEKNFFVRDVVQAAAASPTYFECAQIESHASIAYPLIDGGVFANNPALCAYAEAHAVFEKRAAEMAILSLGTGSFAKSYSWEEAKDWGLAAWAKPLIDIMMSGVAETVDFQLRQLFSASGALSQYLRIQPWIATSSSDLDDVRPENLDQLRQDGGEAAIDRKAEIERFVQLLV